MSKIVQAILIASGALFWLILGVMAVVAVIDLASHKFQKWMP